MAGEVGHVVYGTTVLHYLGPKVTSPLYWAGTLFPDIGHIGSIQRHRTHPDDVSLESLVGRDDFATGVRVHAWIDATREKFLHAKHMKELLPWHPFVPHALKLLEDELLYNRFEDWNLIHRVLGKTYEQEKQYIQNEETIKQWHSVLQNYLGSPPTDATRLRLSIDIGLSEGSAQEINSVVARLRTEDSSRNLMESFLLHLNSLLA